jgi:hypothetical protein
MATQAPPKAQAKQVQPRSFLVGTQTVWEGNDYDQTYTATNGAAGIPWPLTGTGWLRGLWLECTGTGLTAGTVAADAPFNIFSNIELDDVNNEAIFGPFDGYTAFLTNLLGGYYFADNPATSPIFALSGTTSTNNFTFMLYIPLEIVNREPLGPVASVNNTAALTLRFTINSTANVFATPTGTLSVRVRGSQDFYWQPRKTDAMGNPISGQPPAAGTTQYWTQGSVAVAGAGTINQPLVTALGYPFREYLFLLRDNTGARSGGETNWPDPLIALRYEANNLVSQFTKNAWKQLIAKQTGYISGTADTRSAGAATGKENGVYGLFFNDDFFLNKVGGETHRSYLQTSPGSNIIFNGAIGGAGNLYQVVNYCAPGGKGSGQPQNTALLTGGR